MKKMKLLNLAKQQITEPADTIVKSETGKSGVPNALPVSETERETGPKALSAKEIIDLQIKIKPPVVDKLMDNRDALLITGTTGIGKTLLASEIGMYIAQGGYLFETQAFSIDQPHRVLFAQSEISIKNMKFRLSRQSEELNINDDTLNQIILPWKNDDVRINGDLLNGFANTLTEYIVKYKIEVIILDPLISYHTANENDNVQIRRALDVLTKLSTTHDVSIILCHHHGKLDLQGHHAARGASAIADWASTILTLKKKDSENISVEISKVRNFEMSPGFNLRREKGSLIFSPAETKKGARAAAVKGILERNGGKVDSQNELNKLVQNEMGVSSRTGLEAIKEAIAGGDIIVEEVEGRKNQKRLRTAP